MKARLSRSPRRREGWVLGRGPLPTGGGVWADFLLFDLKMEHFGAVFKLDLTRDRFLEKEVWEPNSGDSRISKWGTRHRRRRDRAP